MSDEFNNDQQNTFEPTPPPEPGYQTPPPEPAQYQAQPEPPQYQAPPQPDPSAYYAQGAPGYQPTPAGTPSGATVSLILGIIALVLSFGSAVIFPGIISIIVGIVSIVMSKKAAKQWKTGAGTAGFVLSIIGIILSAIMLIVWGIFGSALLSLASYY